MAPLVGNSISGATLAMGYWSDQAGSAGLQALGAGAVQGSSLRELQRPAGVLPSQALPPTWLH